MICNADHFAESRDLVLPPLRPVRFNFSQVPQRQIWGEYFGWSETY